MASLTYSCLQKITANLRDSFSEAKIQKIRDMGDGRVALEVFVGGRKSWLQLWVIPQCAGLYLGASALPSAQDGAGVFARSLRKHLSNARIATYDLDAGDRILILGIRAGPLPYSLVFEVFGANPNLFLLNETGRILAQIRGGSAGGRNLHPGEDYIRPKPNPNAPDPTPEDTVDSLHFNEDFHNEIRAQLEQQYESLGVRDLLAERGRPLRKEQKRLKRLASRLSGDLKKAGDPHTLRNHAHVLGACLISLTKGQTLASLINPGIEGLPPTVEIPLNPALSPQENMDSMYRRARRAERTQKEAAARLARATKELSSVETELRELMNLSQEELRESMHSHSTKTTTVGGPKPKIARGIEKVAHMHTGADGALILVGKNAKANDTLLRRYAHGNDHWLHIRDGRGSHVIVRSAPGTEASDATIRKAAALAAGYSSLRSEAQVDVLWTQCKYVRSTKGNAAGTVHISRSSTLRVAPARPERG